MFYRDVAAPTDCPSCIAWHAEYQRAALLLERCAMAEVGPPTAPTPETGR